MIFRGHTVYLSYLSAWHHENTARKSPMRVNHWEREFTVRHSRSCRRKPSWSILYVFIQLIAIQARHSDFQIRRKWLYRRNEVSISTDLRITFRWNYGIWMLSREMKSMQAWTVNRKDTTRARLRTICRIHNNHKETRVSRHDFKSLRICERLCIVGE